MNPQADNTSYPVHSCTGKRDINPIWYRLTAPASATVYVVAESGSKQSDTPTVITAYPGASAPGAELACSVGAAGAPGRATFAVARGQSYLIELSGGGDSSGGLYAIIVGYVK